MNSTLQKIFQAIMQTEETVLPIFIHDPVTQKIAGAVVVAESIFAQAFGLVPPVSTTATTANAPSTQT